MINLWHTPWKWNRRLNSSRILQKNRGCMVRSDCRGVSYWHRHRFVEASGWEGGAYTPSKLMPNIIMCFSISCTHKKKIDSILTTHLNHCLLMRFCTSAHDFPVQRMHCFSLRQCQICIRNFAHENQVYLIMTFTRSGTLWRVVMHGSTLWSMVRSGMHWFTTSQMIWLFWT